MSPRSLDSGLSRGPSHRCHFESAVADEKSLCGSQSSLTIGEIPRPGKQRGPRNDNRAAHSQPTLACGEDGAPVQEPCPPILIAGPPRRVREIKKGGYIHRPLHTRLVTACRGEYHPGLYARRCFADRPTDVISSPQWRPHL